jgi:general secretion pathway protein K
MLLRSVSFQRESGVALIVVLWMLVVMTAVALAFSQRVRTEVMLTANYQNQAKALSLAEAGIWRGAAMVLNRSIAENNGENINLAGSVYELDSEHGKLNVSLQSCSGLIDINRASPEIIKALLQTVASPAETQQTILDSLLDWRDEDDLKRLSGAEDDDYRAQGLSYGPRNGLMNSVSELARVNGVTSIEYEALQSSVTVYSGQSRIDVTSAPRRVLASLPAMDDSMTDSILNERETGNKHIDLTQIPAETRKYIGAGQNEFIRISSFAEVSSSVSGIIAVIKLEATELLPVTVMSWRQHVDTVFVDKSLN